MLNEIEAQEVAEGFEYVCGIPNIIGAIDGNHIPILPPAVGYRDFINRKGWLPLYNALAGVDHFYRFRYASCQHVGSVHVASVLKDSNLYKFANALIPKWSKTIEGNKVPPILLGDPAYPLLPWLLKGFKGNVTAEEESFNVYLSCG
ncbi:hypothetical protein PR048_005539 [Dryococelus australis]|uniref:DDE Tnp4 domain-containing protein n=1 Tax=Dryococelus australis TaxID=614101 RepID=A0ABQ9IAL6_9NEOP|nr:hypothetical protein PR048_005539 [Dryococelus australis]